MNNQKLEQVNQTLLSLCAEVSKINLRLDQFENNFMEELRSLKSALLSAFGASAMKGQLYSQKAAAHLATTTVSNFTREKQ